MASIVITDIENWTGPTGEQKRGSLKGSSIKHYPSFTDSCDSHRRGDGSEPHTASHISVTPSQFLCIRFRGRTLFQKESGYLQRAVVKVPLETAGDYISILRRGEQLTHQARFPWPLLHFAESHDKTNLKIQNCSTFLS